MGLISIRFKPVYFLQVLLMGRYVTKILKFLFLTVEQVYIWDLKDPSKPYSPTPGARSTKLDEITSVAWNQQVPSVLAGASTTGYTVVWDLRGKREVVALAYGGGAGTMAGRNMSTSGMAAGGRRGMSAIAWHPDNVSIATRDALYLLIQH